MELIEKNPGIHFNDLVDKSKISEEKLYRILYGINSWQFKEDEEGNRINPPTLKIIEVKTKGYLLRGLEKSTFYFCRYLEDLEVKEIYDFWMLYQ